MFKPHIPPVGSFEIFQISCDEKIPTKNIKKFLETNLKSQTTMTKDCVYFYIYCKVLKIYQIYKIKKPHISSVIFEPLLCGLLYDTQKLNRQKNYLFVTDGYVSLFVAGSFAHVYIKDTATTTDTIKEFLTQQNIDIYDTIQLYHNDITKLKQNHKNYKKLQKLNQIKYSQTYIIFAILAIVLLGLYLNKNEATVQIKQQLNIAPTIKAIVSGEVLIDNKWYKRDDNYQDYKIAQIAKTQVVLVLKNRQIIVKVADDDR